MGSDGTVGANKNSVKIIGDTTDLYAQGYFVYDSKKSGSRTMSHLRVSPRPIESTYLIGEADFVAIHRFDFFEDFDPLEIAAHGATVFLNSPIRPMRCGTACRRRRSRTWSRRTSRLWTVDADEIAREAGLGLRINTVLQTCFFHLTDLMPNDQAIESIKDQIRKTYGKRGQVVVRRNEEAVDRAIAGLSRSRSDQDPAVGTWPTPSPRSHPTS